MIRWLWAALGVCATLYLCVNDGDPTVIVVNVALDARLICGALRSR